MSRVTAPVSRLSRAITSKPASLSNPLLDSTAHAHHAGAALMPKYADLLSRGARNSEHSDSSRGLSTTHRPTPQPSLANRSKPLMQPFHTTTPSSATPPTHLDAAIIPNMADDDATPEPLLRVPLLPDAYAANHASLTPSSSSPSSSSSTAAAAAPEVLIVAADPDNVLPGTPMLTVEAPSMDGVDLKFVHEQQHQQSHDAGAAAGEESTLMGDLWRGMMDDVFGPRKTAP